MTVPSHHDHDHEHSDEHHPVSQSCSMLGGIRRPGVLRSGAVAAAARPCDAHKAHRDEHAACHKRRQARLQARGSSHADMQPRQLAGYGYASY